MALSAERNTPSMGLGIPQRMAYPVLNGVKIYKGSLVCITAAGYAKPMVAASSLVAVGRASETVDNTDGNAGDLTINVEQGVFKWAVNGTAVTIADIGVLAYGYDDQTITKSSSSASIAGTIYGVDSDGGAWICTYVAPAVDGSSLSAEIATRSAYQANAMHAVTIPVILSTARTNSVLATFTPGMSGTIKKLTASVLQVSSTTASGAAIHSAISGSALSGGVLTLTNANTATLGAAIAGTSVSGANAFTAGQAVTLVASTGDFTEGQVLLYLFLQAS